MTEDKSREEIYQERIGWAHIWLKGYMTDNCLQWRRAYYDAGSDEDHRGRMALAQLLMNGEAPKEILQLLAAAIAPNDPDFPSWGSRVFDEHTPPPRYPPERLTRRLNFGKRTTTPVPDTIFNGQVLSAIQTRLSGGVSKAKAFQEVAGELHMSPSTVRDIWKRCPEVAIPFEAYLKEKRS